MSSNARVRKSKATLVTLSMVAAVSSPAPGWAQAITCPQNMLFGTIVPCSGAAGTVTIAPDATPSSAPGCLSVSGSQLQGRCFVTGTLFPVQAMQVSITAGTETIVDGANNMDVNGFVLQDGSGNGNAPVIDVTVFMTSINVGGTLNVDVNQAGGHYTGAVTVSVVYQ